jgi:hypothetical protein
VKAQARATLERLEPRLGRAAELLVLIAGAVLLLALFLPWYEFALPLENGEGGRPRLDEPTGWEAFKFADLLVAAMGLVGLGSAVVARVLGSRAPHVVAAHAGWVAVVVLLYSYHRPAIVGSGIYPGPPAGGFFLALWAAGAITGGAVTALLARPREADEGPQADERPQAAPAAPTG